MDIALAFVRERILKGVSDRFVEDETYGDGDGDFEWFGVDVEMEDDMALFWKAVQTFFLASNISGEVHRVSNWASEERLLPIRCRLSWRHMKPSVMTTAKNCAMAQNHCESLPIKFRRISAGILLVVGIVVGGFEVLQMV